MGNPSNWISEPKKGDFSLFKFFFRKIVVFWCKIKKKILLILFVPECPETRFRHNLQLFLLYKSIKTGKRGQFWHFLRFLVIFWWLSLLAKFRGYSTSEWPFSALNLKIQCLEHTWMRSAHSWLSITYPLKIRSKFKKDVFLVKKKRIFFLLILFVPKAWETHFLRNLLLFLPYKSTRRDKTGQIFQAVGSTTALDQPAVYWRLS